jgi:hypothetical protein
LITNNTFRLIPEIRINEVYRGIDYQGRHALILKFEEIEPKLDFQTALIRSTLAKDGEGSRLSLTLESEDEPAIEIFEIFVDDLTNALKRSQSEEELIEKLGKRFIYWTALFAKKRAMNQNAKWVQGVWGELYFLHTVLSEKIGKENAVKSWIGPQRGNQDFHTENRIFEVKTKSLNKPTVKISNENQLSQGMYLAVLHVNRSSEVSEEAQTLYELIQRIAQEIREEPLLRKFQQDLLELGLFPFENAKEYDSIAFICKRIDYFRTDAEFPFIDAANIPAAVPQYQYLLNLADVEKFKKEETWVFSVDGEVGKGKLPEEFHQEIPMENQNIENWDDF